LRRQFIEDEHRIHAFEVRQNLRALLLGNHRAAGAFQRADALVAIHANDQRVSHRAGRFQQFDVAGMEQVVAAVCENHALAVAFPRAKLQNEFFES